MNQPSFLRAFVGFAASTALLSSAMVLLAALYVAPPSVRGYFLARAAFFAPRPWRDCPRPSARASSERAFE